MYSSYYGYSIPYRISKCNSNNNCPENHICKKIIKNDNEIIDCVPKINFGEQCSYDSDCISNKCIINKCANENGKFIKDMVCTMDEQCEDNLICRKSNNIMKCKELGFEGDDCYSDEHCSKNLWCSLENKCIMKQKDGEYCFGYDKACISGKCKNMYCMTNNNGSYYVSEGSPGCITDNDCMPGLICSNMGYKQLVCQKK